ASSGSVRIHVRPSTCPAFRRSGRPPLASAAAGSPWPGSTRPGGPARPTRPRRRLPRHQPPPPAAHAAQIPARLRPPLPQIRSAAIDADELVPVGLAAPADAGKRGAMPGSPHLAEQFLEIAVPVTESFSLQVEMIMT